MYDCYYHNLTLFLYLFPTAPHHHSSRHLLQVQLWVEGTLDVKLQVEVLGMWTLWLDGLPQKANQAVQNKSRQWNKSQSARTTLLMQNCLIHTMKYLYDHKQKMLCWLACEEPIQAETHKFFYTQNNNTPLKCLNTTLICIFYISLTWGWPCYRLKHVATSCM